jgi:hypothetical protein
VSFDKYHVTTASGALSFALKILFLYRIFFIFATQCLNCDLIWAIRISSDLYCDIVALYLEFIIIRNSFCLKQPRTVLYCATNYEKMNKSSR